MDIAISKFFILVSVFLFGCSDAKYKYAECIGNIETFDKKIIRNSVGYNISYLIDGKNSKIRIAGREIDASASKGKTYNGYWLMNNTELSYLSYLPDDGGTIKFKLESDEWFVGVCHNKSPN